MHTLNLEAGRAKLQQLHSQARREQSLREVKGTNPLLRLFRREREEVSKNPHVTYA